MQINRLFEIVYILLDKKRVTARELSQRFEVSTRTIYRDIETLSSAGIPIYMSKGKGGGISLLPDFILNKVVLTETEKEEILSSLKAVSSFNPSKTDTALNKLRSLFGETNTNWIEVDFSSWTDVKNESQTFNIIKEAILSKKIISFSYFSVKGEHTIRNVEPLKLCFKGGAWYLYGYCKFKSGFRFFKLRRIKEILIREHNFERKIPEKIFNDKDMFQGQNIRLKLKISSEASYRVYDEFDVYEKQNDGSFIVEIDHLKSEWIFYYIISFGKYCEVLEPKSIRESIKKEIKDILKNYI